MARSERTTAELEAMAMLLGYEYDDSDHTFVGVGDDNRVFDPDTMEFLGKVSDYVSPEPSGQYSWRRAMVREGRMGAADYGGYFNG